MRVGKSWDQVPSAPSTDIQAVLAAIASLQAELSQAMSDICNKTDEHIAVVSTALRSDIAALIAQSDAAFSAVNSRLDSQSDTLESLEANANATSDTVVDLEWGGGRMDACLSPYTIALGPEYLLIKLILIFSGWAGARGRAAHLALYCSH